MTPLATIILIAIAIIALPFVAVWLTKRHTQTPAPTPAEPVPEPTPEPTPEPPVVVSGTFDTVNVFPTHHTPGSTLLEVVEDPLTKK